MSKKKIKPRSAKNKGRKLQVWVAQKISELTGISYGMDKEIESRQMGQAGTDVRLSKEALKEFPYSVECKAVEKLSLPSWIEQAKENQVEGTNWLVIFKRSRDKPVVVMDAERFFELLKEKNKNDNK